MTVQALKTEMVAAMKSKDAVRLSVLRGLLSSCTNELVAKGRKPIGELSEEEVGAVIRRAGKQRKDSIEQFQKGGRADLVEKESAELEILERLLPPLLSKEDVAAAVREKAAFLNTTDKAQATQLMSALMKELKGKADGAVVKEAVDAFFA